VVAALENLIELKVFAGRTSDVEVLSAFLPEGKEDRPGFKRTESGAGDGLEGGVDIGDIEGNVVDMTVGTGSESPRERAQEARRVRERCRLAASSGHGPCLLHEKAGVHDKVELQTRVKACGRREAGDGDTDVLDAREFQLNWHTYLQVPLICIGWRRISLRTLMISRDELCDRGRYISSLSAKRKVFFKQ
jgi:hypothetical protein